MAAMLQSNTPLAEQLSGILQPKLVDIGWSSGGGDDSALAEYIVLMLVNGKTQDQIASELSTELLNLGPEDSTARDFARWLFEQVEVLSGQANGAPSSAAHEQASTQSIPSFTGNESEHLNDAQNLPGGQDAEMGDAIDSSADFNIPTGPKNMRPNGRNQGNRRLIGQLNKAMDRTSDFALHRVRGQSGERINMHNRGPPRGPRGSGAQPRSFNNGLPSGPKGHMQNRNQPMMNPQFSQQQQMQLFNLLSQMMSPNGQGMMMPGAPTPAINPNFRGPNQSNGKSLFERVEGRPNRNQSFHKKPFSNSHATSSQTQDTENGEDVSMEDTPQKPTLGPDTICKYNLKCTKADCIFAHQSPAAPSGTTVDVNDTCSFGAACQNRKCVGRHPSPATKKAHQAEQDCKFYPNCTNPNCPFKHPSMPLCRNGADCKVEGCKFTHLQTKCKFNPCMNRVCPYKHEEGQKRGAYGDMVWTSDQAKTKEHVSERKFVSDDGDEELIVPQGEEVEVDDVDVAV